MAFSLVLPKARPCGAQTITAGFNDDFLVWFSEDSKVVAPSSANVATDEWAELSVDKAGRVSIGEGRSVAANQESSSTAEPESLPDLNTVERPEYLTKRPPYHLLLHASLDRIVLQGSHQGTLEFVADYLGRWGKLRVTDVRKVSFACVLEEVNGSGVSIGNPC
jgi:hypothetical protein